MAVPMPDINMVMVLPETVIAVGAMGLLLAGAWKTELKLGSTTVAMLAMLIILVAAILLGPADGGPGRSTLAGLFVTDSFALYMKMLLCLATALPLMISWEYLQANKLQSAEYQVLTLFALLGGMVMASSGDFMILYLGLEMMSLSIYVLAAYQRDNLLSNEAGLKYFILGSMASGLLLYGISLIYGATGTTLFSGVKSFLLHDPGESMLMLHLGVILILAGMSFKIAAAPFHMWAPDVYQGAPTSVTAFMAVMPKIAAFAGLYRVLLDALAPISNYWSTLFQVMAVLSLVVGAVVAIAQTNIKRMLAYSSIGHVGFILLGLTAGTILGLESVLIYLAIYIFMSVGAFAMIMFLNQGGIGDDINDYKGLAHKRPLLALVMAIFMFSMAGIPPLAGFIGKFYVFLAAIKAGYLGLSIFAVIFSAVGAFYYLRIVKLMYFDQPENEFTMVLGMPSRLVLGLSSVVILVWGVFPSWLINMAKQSIILIQ